MTTVSTTSGGVTAIGATDQDLPAGTEVGEYRIEALIGKGGFGTVYRAVHPVIGKVVAIKVLARKYAADEAIVSRFVAEARAVNQINHRNIIDIFLFAQLPDGRHYYVMEYLDGEPLDRHLERHGPMPLAEALPILRALARALDAAHAKGIAHRDLKPENIYLARDPDGATFPKLLDFGIAKLLAPEDDIRHRTGTGVPLGTPYYMSPEQCRGREIDHRTDIYSFGIVVYRLLTGTYPFEAPDFVELLFKQVNEEAPPPSSKNPALPATVDAAVAWMMRKDRAQRPRSVLEGVLALDPSAVSEADRRTSRPSLPPGTSAPAITPDAFAVTTAQTPKSPARSRPTVWIGSALVLVCSAAALVLVLGHSTERAEPPGGLAQNINPTNGSGSGSGSGSNVLEPLKTDSEPVRDVEIAIAMKIPAHATTTFKGKHIDLPGKLSLPRSTEPIELTIDAPNFEPGKLVITPDKSQTVEVPALEPRRLVRPKKKTDPHDVIDHDQIFGTDLQ